MFVLLTAANFIDSKYVTFVPEAVAGKVTVCTVLVCPRESEVVIDPYV